MKSYLRIRNFHPLLQLREILDLGNYGSSSLLLKHVRFKNGRGRNTFSLLSTSKMKSYLNIRNFHRLLQLREILDLGNHGSSSLLLKHVRFRNGRGRNTFSLLSTVKDEIVSRNEISIDYCNYEKFSIWETMDLLPSC